MIAIPELFPQSRFTRLVSPPYESRENRMARFIYTHVKCLWDRAAQMARCYAVGPLRQIPWKIERSWTTVCPPGLMRSHFLFCMYTHLPFEHTLNVPPIFLFLVQCYMYSFKYDT